MKIVLFTSNQPRHLAIAEMLISHSQEVHVVVEAGTLFPGQNPGVFKRSEVMATYFGKVNAAERNLFGAPRPLVGAASVSVIVQGELSSSGEIVSELIESSDLVIVFGSSYIRGTLVDALIEAKAVNIHMGISPYYRGNSCNFWALYDGCPELVGATVHRLDSGLDSGEILFHSFPTSPCSDAFEFSMSAVEQVGKDLIRWINGSPTFAKSVPQDQSLQIRFSKALDFDDAIAADFLSRDYDATDIAERLAGRALPGLLRI